MLRCQFMLTMTCYLATVMVNDKINDEKQSTLSAGHFDCHGDAPVQYKAHCPIQHAQGYFGSHWMPASGNYSLRITPASSRATGKQTTINKQANKTSRLMAIAMRRQDTTRVTQWRRSRASLEATGCRHRASTHSNSYQSDMQTPVFPMFFIVKLSKKATKHKDSSK